MNLKEFYNLFSLSYIQTFDDTKKGRKGFVKSFPMSEIKKHKDWLIEKNKKGMGVFFTPNPCIGGRKEKNVTAIEWLYVDMDEGTKQEMLDKIGNAPMYPNIVVESSRGYHLYWRAYCDKDQFTQITKGLIEYFDGDAAISSTNEVLRLPGFLHMKNPDKPFKVRLVANHPSPAYNPEELLEAYPHTTPMEKFRKRHELDDEDLALVKDIPIKDVLQKLGVQVKSNAIYENGEETSARINVADNYINRFSGKEGSGSTIDAVMAYGKKTLPEAIDYLRDMAGIKPVSQKKIAKSIARQQISTPSINLDSKVFTWGTDKLDNLIAPMSTSHYAILAGETGAGKTTLAFHIALKNAELDNKVLFLSLEMSPEEILLRKGREHAGISKPEWRDKSRIEKHKLDKMQSHMDSLANKKNLTLRGVPGATAELITDIIEETKPDLVLIDNFDLIAKNSRSTEYSEQNRIAEHFRVFALNFKGAIIILHHINTKKNIRTQSSVSNLRGSQKIVHHAGLYLKCFRQHQQTDPDQVLSEVEKAALTLVTPKDRDWGDSVFVTVYYHEGNFHDKFPKEIDYTSADWWNK